MLSASVRAGADRELPWGTMRSAVPERRMRISLHRNVAYKVGSCSASLLSVTSGDVPLQEYS